MSLNAPFFTVVIPTFNRANMISGAIKSVLEQTFKDFELIVIDDGSTDQTAHIIAGFNDERIKYNYQHNTERSQARNNGIKLARGRYICFLDSDDQYCSNHLQVFYEYVTQYHFPVALLFSNPIVIHQNIEKKDIYPSPEKDDVLSYILHHSIIPDRVCIHRSIFDKYLFNPAVCIGEDTILWAQITTEFPLLHLNAYTIKYQVHDDNSVNLKNNVYRDRLNGLLELFEQQAIKKRLNRKLKNEIISVCYYGIARHHQLKRNFLSMCMNALMSILYNINNPQTKAKLYMIYAYFR
jgi:glycosyltransferase involved in cell wall biosynthesis